MKKSLKSFTLLFVVFAIFLAGCSSDSSGGASSGKNEIIVGEIDPLTGPAAVYGAAQSDALKMAIEEINNAGGVTVQGQKYTFKQISYDDKGDPNEAISAS